jgi:hypothetical protein
MSEEQLPLDVCDPPEPHDRLLQFFAYNHLPEPLQEATAPFWVLAQVVVNTMPLTPERTVCLRKLLEARDAAVRARLCQADEPTETNYTDKWSR